MPIDASLPPHAPTTNGLAEGHGETDVSPLLTTLAEVCADLHSRVSAFLSASPKDEVTRRTQDQTRMSIGVVEKALKDYGFPQLSLSYNGGKDCLVLLILYLSVLHTHFTQPVGRRKDEESPFPTSVPSIYAKPPDPFPAVSSFVASSTKAYHLDLVHIPTVGKSTNLENHSTPLPHSETPQLPSSESTKPESETAFTFPAAFGHYLSLHTSIRAIFVGTRRTDPHGAKLLHFSPTDKNWPSFMRIHPVIDWHLSEIWSFLRADELRDPRTGERLEYCSMYDEGYTSLGGVGDTLRNPKLKYVNEKDGSLKYRPAFEMTEDDEERLGRE